MKKCFAFLAVSLLLLSFCFSGNAEGIGVGIFRAAGTGGKTTDSSKLGQGVDFYIPDYEVSITVPLGIGCVTRESDETNSFFQNKYFDYKTTHQYLLDNSFYVYGMTVDMMGEFAFIITDNGGTDFSTMSDVSLSFVGYQLEASFTSAGITDKRSEIYTGKNNRAIKLHYTYETQEGKQYVLFYYTTHGSELYMIRFISFFSEISDEQEKMIQDAFESLAWGKQNYTTEPKGETDISIYKDYETGLTFMVPSGWSEVKFVAAEEGKKVKYRIGTEDVWVLYESGDYWDLIVDAVGSDNLYGFTRKDVDNGILSEEMIAGMLGCSVNDITRETIDGQEYYCMRNSQTVSSGSVSVDTQDKVYICMRDAYLYWFQISGRGISKFEDQFNRFMKTIEYP